MRQFLSLLFLLGLLTTPSIAQKKVPAENLDDNNGLIYERYTMEPFTGFGVTAHRNGKKKERVPFKDGKMHGVAKEWDVEGRLVLQVKYENGKKHGKEIQHYKTGRKKLEINYQNGVPHGMVIEYHRNGQIMSKGEFLNGQYQGVHKWWFADGSIDQEIPYTGGVAHGTIKNWYNNKQLRKTAQFQKGIQHGVTTEWYENGKKMQAQNYVQAVKDGEFNFWAKDGRLLEKKIYERGKVVKAMDYHSASLKTPKGYDYVFNLLNTNCIVTLEGEKVEPINSGKLTFLVDGKVVQLFTLVIDDLKKEANENLSEGEILSRYLQVEKKYIEYELDTTIKVKPQKKMLANGKSVLQWSFDMPKAITKGKLKIVGEEYLSFVVKNHVLSVNGLVMSANTTNEIQTLIEKIANSLIEKDAPIDIIQLSKELLKP